MLASNMANVLALAVSAPVYSASVGTALLVCFQPLRVSTAGTTVLVVLLALVGLAAAAITALGPAPVVFNSGELASR